MKTIPVVLLLAAATMPLRAVESASATYTSSVIDATHYRYDVTLTNTGTTNIGSFWFAWSLGQNYLPTIPANLRNPTAWSSAITGGVGADGFGILWTAQGGGVIAPGGSLSGFGFDSTTTPSQMAGVSVIYTTKPVTTSYVFVGAPQSDPGYPFVVSAATAVTGQPLRFVPITPCRVADTRNAAGAFGAPTLAAGTSRDFNIPASGCGIPTIAAAYSLNVTVVPKRILSYLTLWPSGTAQPQVSTLNSLDGRIKANAAIVPASINGSVSVFATDATDVLLDINGYFEAGNMADLAFYPLAPCRIADTRSAAGSLGGPIVSGGQTRSFPVLASGCNVPSTARAYSLNVTAVPTSRLGYLTAFPTGVAQPGTSTLNATTGAITANAAILQAGTGGAVSVYVSNDTHVILDINGYFAPPAAGGLQFYSVAPCRAVDTRTTPAGMFSAPALVGQSTRTFPLLSSACNISAAAQAYALNATVVPQGRLGYLSLWPTGQAQPTVSTLNAVDGAITSNFAIVPGGNGGAINAFSSDNTNVLFDVTGYFAP